MAARGLARAVRTCKACRGLLIHAPRRLPACLIQAAGNMPPMRPTERRRGPRPARARRFRGRPLNQCVDRAPAFPRPAARSPSGPSRCREPANGPPREANTCRNPLTRRPVDLCRDRSPAYADRRHGRRRWPCAVSCRSTAGPKRYDARQLARGRAPGPEINRRTRGVERDGCADEWARARRLDAVGQDEHTGRLAGCARTTRWATARRGSRGGGVEGSRMTQRQTAQRFAVCLRRCRRAADEDLCR